MYFFLSYNNFEKVILLPINPGTFSVNGGQTVNTSEIVGVGEISQIGNSRLKTIQFASYFPKHYSSNCSTLVPFEPYEYVKILEQWQRSGRPIRLIITDTPVNMAVAIQEFQYSEEGGSRNVNYNISLIEYKFLKTHTIEGVINNSNIGRPQNKSNGNVYIVKKGDSLYKIAKLTTGDGSNWEKIYELNKKTIGNDPNKIQIGMKLLLNGKYISKKNKPTLKNEPISTATSQRNFLDLIY